MKRLFFAVALVFSPQTAGADDTLAVQVLDVQILPETQVDGLPMAEISGLGWDGDNGVLYGVSDRATLFRFDLDVTDDRLARLEPVAGAELRDADGEPLKSKIFDPEGMAILSSAQDGQTLLILSETGPRAAAFDGGGQMLHEVALPAGLDAALDERRGKHGPESLTVLPDGTLVTAPEVAVQLDDGGFRHDLLTGEGPDLSFSQDAETRLKSIMTLADGRLLMLERQGKGKDLRPNLRLLDPAGCTDDGDCPTVAMPVAVPDVTDADYEGLTQIGDDLFLMVSDDRIKKEQRSVFVLMRLRGL